MAGTITAANAVLTLTVDGLYSQVQLQKFSADNIFETDAVSNTETMMGVDGNFSAGFVFAPIVFNVSLMADSDSNVIFETWYEQEQAALDKFEARMTARLPSIGRSYALTRGFLTSTPPTANAGRVLQPRRHTITFARKTSAPI